MSVISLNTNVTYVSTGSVGPYPFNFPISDPTALMVTAANVVIPSSSYTIAPVNNDYDNGGSITFNVAPAVGVAVVLQRATPLTQGSVFTDNMPQPMKQIEAALDKLTEIDQELAASIAAAGGGGGGGGGVTQYFAAGNGLVLTGAGTLTNPYTYSIATAFSISSFTGGQAGEIGQQFINPAFSIGYGGTPTGANITNTAGINTPFNLTSPYTSASITGTFTRSTPGTITFTLTATNGVTSPQATQALTFNERIFGGVGTIGATSTVTASGTGVLLSTGSVIPSAALATESVGQTFGPFNPAGQAVYLLLSGGSHTFVDAVSGFPFAFNAPIAVTFVNQYGVSLTMYLYQSTNALTGNFQPRIVS